MTITTTLFMMILLLSACGGGGDSGGGDTANKPKTVFDPWKGIGAETEEAGERVRALSFSDGMTISYDGSSASGEESVCRRGMDGDFFYEVCMPLEDDPYFVMQELNALVWRPLMFDRFGVELSCYRWAEGDAAKTDADCQKILGLMGGEDFTCQAGLVDGDKALKCSDDWAVVVNGKDDDPKTLCRVHVETGAGRCLGAFSGDSVLAMQRSGWEGYRSHRDNSGQFAAGDSAIPLAPQGLPAGARLTYQSGNEDICTVDGDDSDGGTGSVTILPGVTAPEVCKVFLTVKAPGFADRVLFADLPILRESDAVWPNYIRNNNYFYPGERLGAEEVVSSSPAKTENEFASLNESVCTVVSETGEVTALVPGECVIRLIARAEGFLDVVIDRTIPVDALRGFAGSIEWQDFADLDSTAVSVGSTATLGDPQVLDGNGDPAGSVVVSFESLSESCSYAHDGSDHTIVFEDGGECGIKVSASADERGSESIVREFRFTPGEGSFTLAWTGYAGGATYDSPAPAVNPPSTTPVLEVDYVYSKAGDACEIDGESGALTILGAGSCEVTLVATRSGYAEETQSHTVTVAKKAQTLTVPTNPYGGALSVKNGETLLLVNAPEGGIGELVYGTSGGSCSVEAATGSVTAEAASGNCAVTARRSGDDNHAASSDTALATIAMVAGSNTDPVWSGTPYASNPAVGAAAVSPANGAVGSGTGAPEFRSKTPDICTVASDGGLSGVSAGVDACMLEVRFVGNASTGASGWVDSPAITVDKGAHPALAGSNYYGAGATVATEGALELVNPPEGKGAATYSTSSSSHCEVASDTGVVRGISRGDCVVQVAFAGDDDYNALPEQDLQTVSVLDLDQEIDIDEPYGASPALRVGDTLALVNAPTATAGENPGGSVTYRVASASDNSCSVVAGDGTVTALKPGNCIVEVEAAAVSGYNATVRELATIPVSTGTLAALSWIPYRSGVEYRAGTEKMIGEVDTASIAGVTVRYRVVDAGDTECAFKGQNGNDALTLRLGAYGNCTLEATASARHYEDWSAERILRVRPGTIQVTPGAFANGAKLEVEGGPVSPGSYTGLNPSDADIRWELTRGEKDCVLINDATGEVEALVVPIGDPPPLCSLQLVASAEGYDNYRSGPVSIPLEKGDMPGLDSPIYGTGGGKLHFVTAENPDDGDNPLKEGYIDVTYFPNDSHVYENYGIVVVTESFSVTGYESNGSTSKADVCEVQNDATLENFGRVSVGSAAAAGDQCHVVATASAVGYNSQETTAVVLTLVSDELEFGTDLNPEPVLTFDGELKIGPNVSIDISNLPERYNTDDQGSSLPITWEFKGDWVNDRGLNLPFMCVVAVNFQDSDELLLIVNREYVYPGDSCVIRALAQVGGFREYEIELNLPILAGDFVFADDSDKKILYSGTLRLGGNRAPGYGDNRDDLANKVKSWGSWRTVGFAAGTDRSDSAEDTEKENVCSVEAEGVVSTGESAAAGDICEVYGVAMNRAHFNDSDELLVGTLTVGAAADFGTLAPPVYGGELALRGVPIEIETEPSVSPSINKAITWTYSGVGKRSGVATDNICSVNENDGTVSLGSDAALEDTCEVVATANAAGYVEESARALVLTVKDTFTSLGWDSFPTEGVVGVTVDLSAAGDRPVSVPAADSFDVVKKSGDCTYANDDTLTFADTTECVLTLTASKTGYVDFSRTFRLTPGLREPSRLRGALTEPSHLKAPPTLPI